MPNRLADETSPYLIQHADNPVDWRPWGPEALAEAVSLNKPILLSVGYAACHWCHVMAHESFENPHIAQVMNELFVNIKVDREERPDLDAIYQGALALMGQPGGWPLTMFCTPQGEPFAGGTYFPPEGRYGRPGFPDVLNQIARIWQSEPERIAKSRDQIMSHLGTLLNPTESGELSVRVLNDLAGQVVKLIDLEHGGLGEAPKFPNTPALEFLWQAYLRTGDQTFANAVTTTLTHMCQGGIYDHLGGGFARYSVDTEWLVPHFEKMLYDNAQLIELLTSVWQTTHDPLYAARVEETIDWALREMWIESSGFASSLDADSEGEEGRFYVWTESEIEDLLGPEDGRFFNEVYGVVPGGNFEGRSILNRLEDVNLRSQADEERLSRLRSRLLAARAWRVRPALDDKVLADWNGLMISALARAGSVFERPEWIDTARTMFLEIHAGLTPTREDGTAPIGPLHHSTRDGQLGPMALAEDYANLISAALALYSATADPFFLDGAVLPWLCEIEDRFGAPGGGFFHAGDSASDVIIRSRTIYDNATPPANATMLANYGGLYALTGNPDYLKRANEIIDVFSGIALKAPSGTSSFLNAAERVMEPIVVAIAPGIDNPSEFSTKSQSEIAKLVLASAPAKAAILWLDPDADLPPSHPAHAKTAVDGKPTVYICRGPSCSLPLTDPSEVQNTLKA